MRVASKSAVAASVAGAPAWASSDPGNGRNGGDSRSCVSHSAPAATTTNAARGRARPAARAAGAGPRAGAATRHCAGPPPPPPPPRQPGRGVVLALPREPRGWATGPWLAAAAAFVVGGAGGVWGPRRPGGRAPAPLSGGGG